MKFLLLAALVVFCSASTLYRGKSVSINDDGSILITSPSGKRVVITRPTGLNGQKTIDIAISGPNIPTKRIQIDDGNSEIGGDRSPWSSINSVEEDQLRLKRSSKKDKSQGDVLSDIFKEFQGAVDEPLFEKLLGKVEKAVKKGEISPQIYDLLVELNQIDGGLSGGDIQRGVGGYGSGLGYGQSILSGRYLPWWYNRGISQGQAGVLVGNQIPMGQGVVDLYGNGIGLGKLPYLGTTTYVNPLLQRGYLQSGQNIVDDLLLRQQLNNGIRVLPNTQNIIDDLLIRQQLNGGVTGQSQSISSLLLPQQLTNGVVGVSPNKQNIVDDVLIRQQLNGGVARGWPTGQTQSISSLLLPQQLTNNFVGVLPNKQNIVDDVLIRQQLNGGITTGWPTGQNINNLLLRQQLNGGISRVLPNGLNNDIVIGGVPLGVSRGGTLKEYLMGNQNVPYGQTQGLQGVLSNTPVNYYNQGLKEGYLVRQVQPVQVQGQPIQVQRQPVQVQGQPIQVQRQPMQVQAQPVILQNDRPFYLDNVGIPQVVY